MIFIDFFKFDRYLKSVGLAFSSSDDLGISMLIHKVTVSHGLAILSLAFFFWSPSLLSFEVELHVRLYILVYSSGP